MSRRSPEAEQNPYHEETTFIYCFECVERLHCRSCSAHNWNYLRWVTVRKTRTSLDFPLQIHLSRHSKFMSLSRMSKELYLLLKHSHIGPETYCRGAVRLDRWDTCWTASCSLAVLAWLEYMERLQCSRSGHTKKREEGGESRETRCLMFF